MRVAYLDLFSGISGDMFLAALLDAGALKLRLLEEKLAALGLGAVAVSPRRVRRGALAATQLTFETGRAEGLPHRSLSELRRLIERADLAQGERRRAIALFESLAQAEAKVHHVEVEEVHFHEVGALDSVLDVVGAAVAIEALGIDAWHASRINLGSGSVATAHGRLPVPAPATLELIQGFPTFASGAEAELTTPTGAAILRHLAPRYGLPPARWEAVGYGAGSRDLGPEHPNALRVVLGEALEGARPEAEEVAMIETDLDDMNPQLLPYLREVLLGRGAQDVTWHPLHMKKGRLGVRLSVLSPLERVEELSAVVFRETTTLGLRLYRVEKRRLEREAMDVETPYGRVSVKVARHRGLTVNVAPEYEDCARIARERDVPLIEVMRAASERAHREIDGQVGSEE